MPLPAHQLDAFHAVAVMGSFSKAAERLHVSQPALSQRIQQLESELKKRLFVRSPAGVSLTDAGTRLLRYCQVQRALEGELLDDLTAGGGGGSAEHELSGMLRVAAFSSVARSCVLPALAELFRANPRLAVDVSVRVSSEIAALLGQGAVDFAVLDHVFERPDVEHIALGFEQLVLVEPRQFRMRDDVYLDHDPEDATTMRFLKRSAVKTRYVRRSFFDDIYGVIDAAVHGFGRAVVPQHLLAGSAAEELDVVADTKAMRSPVVLHHFRQPAYTRAHEAVRDALVSGIPRALEGGLSPAGRSRSRAGGSARASRPSI
jgi:DNA-binding transcriptional LysR family regulator